jgi:hypothetical protein
MNTGWPGLEGLGTWVVCHTGSVEYVEKPPPPVMVPPKLLMHTVSVVPLSMPCVAPTAVTHDDDAGKLGWYPVAHESAIAPLSPAAAKIVRPVKATFWAVWSKSLRYDVPYAVSEAP